MTFLIMIYIGKSMNTFPLPTAVFISRKKEEKLELTAKTDQKITQKRWKNLILQWRNGREMEKINIQQNLLAVL